MSIYQQDISSTYTSISPTGVLSFIANPSDIADDLDNIRYVLQTIMGGSNWYDTDFSFGVQKHASTHIYGGSDPIDHDSLSTSNPNIHIDWTNTTKTLVTSGDINAVNGNFSNQLSSNNILIGYGNSIIGGNLSVIGNSVFSNLSVEGIFEGADVTANNCTLSSTLNVSGESNFGISNFNNGISVVGDSFFHNITSTGYIVCSGITSNSGFTFNSFSNFTGGSFFNGDIFTVKNDNHTFIELSSSATKIKITNLEDILEDSESHQASNKKYVDDRQTEVYQYVDSQASILSSFNQTFYLNIDKTITVSPPTEISSTTASGSVAVGITSDLIGFKSEPNIPYSSFISQYRNFVVSNLGLSIVSSTSQTITVSHSIWVLDVNGNREEEISKYTNSYVGSSVLIDDVKIYSDDRQPKIITKDNRFEYCISASMSVSQGTFSIVYGGVDDVIPITYYANNSTINSSYNMAQEGVTNVYDDNIDIISSLKTSISSTNNVIYNLSNKKLIETTESEIHLYSPNDQNIPKISVSDSGIELGDIIKYVYPPFLDNDLDIPNKKYVDDEILNHLERAWETISPEFYFASSNYEDYYFSMVDNTLTKFGTGIPIRVKLAGDSDFVYGIIDRYVSMQNGIYRVYLLANKKINANIESIEYGNERLVRQFDFHLNSTYNSSTNNFCLRDINKEPFKWNMSNAYAVGFTLKHFVDDGTEQPIVLMRKIVPIRGGLVARWGMNEGIGVDVRDVVGSNNGLLKNGATWGTGKSSNCVTFDGVNDYIEIPNSTVLSPSSEFSVSMWVKYDQISSDYQTLVCKNDLYDGIDSDPLATPISYTALPGYKILANNSGYICEICESGEFALINKIAYTFSYEENNSEWIHLCFSVDSGAATGSKIKAYRNSVLLTPDGGYDDTAVSINDTSISLYFGAERNTDYTGLTFRNHLNGSLDDVRFYNNAIDADTVLSIFNGDAADSDGYFISSVATRPSTDWSTSYGNDFDYNSSKLKYGDDIEISVLKVNGSGGNASDLTVSMITILAEDEEIAIPIEGAVTVTDAGGSNGQYLIAGPIFGNKSIYYCTAVQKYGWWDSDNLRWALSTTVGVLGGVYYSNSLVDFSATGWQYTAANVTVDTYAASYDGVYSSNSTYTSSGVTKPLYYNSVKSRYGWWETGQWILSYAMSTYYSYYSIYSASETLPSSSEITAANWKSITVISGLNVSVYNGIYTDYNVSPYPVISGKRTYSYGPGPKYGWWLVDQAFPNGRWQITDSLGTSQTSFYFNSSDTDVLPYTDWVFYSDPVVVATGVSVSASYDGTYSIYNSTGDGTYGGKPLYYCENALRESIGAELVSNTSFVPSGGVPPGNYPVEWGASYWDGIDHNEYRLGSGVVLSQSIDIEEGAEYEVTYRFVFVDEMHFEIAGGPGYISLGGILATGQTSSMANSVTERVIAGGENMVVSFSGGSSAEGAYAVIVPKYISVKKVTEAPVGINKYGWYDGANWALSSAAGTKDATYCQKVSADTTLPDSGWEEAVAMPDNLIAHYKFNESSGVALVDSSGNGYNVNLNGTPTWESGKVGNCINNITNGYHTVNGALNANITAGQSGSVACWIYVDSTTQPPFDLLSKSQSSPSFDFQSIGIYDSSYPPVEHHPSFKFGGDSCYTSSVLTPNQWNHIVWCSSGVSGGWTCYINGVSAALDNGTNNGEWFGDYAAGNGGVIAAYYYQPFSMYVNILKAKIDDLRIYSDVLTQVDVDLIYNSGTGREL